MANPFIIRSDPRFDDDNPMCQGCHVRRASDVHHMQYKGMGGRHGAAKIASESAGNKIKLCRVCHAADHGLKVTESDGFSCALCPRVQSMILPKSWTVPYVKEGGGIRRREAPYGHHDLGGRGDAATAA